MKPLHAVQVGLGYMKLAQVKVGAHREQTPHVR